MNIVFVRGLIREKAHWSPNYTGLLQQGIPKAHQVFLDIPGAGAYFKETTPVSISKIVDKMRAEFLKEIANSPFPNGPNVLISISLGGMISFDWMNRFPDDFQKCLIANTSLRGYNRLFDRLMPKNFPHLFKIASAKNTYEKERLILEMVSNDTEKIEKNTEIWADIQSKRPVSLENTLRQLLAAALFQPPTHAPKTPTLLLKGEGDRMVSPKCSEAIAKKWSLPIKSHPTAGHALFVDDPSWCASMTLEWLKELSVTTQTPGKAQPDLAQNLL